MQRVTVPPLQQGRAIDTKLLSILTSQAPSLLEKKGQSHILLLRTSTCARVFTSAEMRASSCSRLIVEIAEKTPA